MQIAHRVGCLSCQAKMRRAEQGNLWKEATRAVALIAVPT
jgi:hypothetical protein